jgi:protein-S-isoprenylcysteine O-methyltransferase Ste14
MYKTLSVFATLAIIVAAALLLMRHGLFSLAPLPIVLQVIAGALMVWARITFGLRSFHFSANPTEGGLVTSGPYRYLRHPIYAAVLLLIWPGVLANLSWKNLFLGLVITAGTIVRILSEERLLLEHFPEYEAYARRTRRIIPFIL